MSASGVGAADTEALLTEAELAARLNGVSPEWVQKAARKGELPHVRVGRFYRFYWPDVLQHLRGR